MYFGHRRFQIDGKKSLENEFFLKSALRDQKGAAYPYNQNQG